MSKDIACANCGKPITLSKGLLTTWQRPNGICCNAKCRLDLEEKIRAVLPEEVKAPMQRTLKPENVRVAVPQDGEQVLQFLIMGYEENRRSNPDKKNSLSPLDIEKVRRFVNEATHGQGGLIGVIGDVGHLQASICMALSQFWYSSEWHVEELSSFVHPSFRQHRHGRDLIEFGKWFSDSMSTEMQQPFPFFLGILSGERMEAKIKLYQRQLTPRGVFFYHSGNC